MEWTWWRVVIAVVAVLVVFVLGVFWIGVPGAMRQVISATA